MTVTFTIATPEDAPLLNMLGYASYLHSFGHLWLDQTALAQFLERDYSEAALRVNLNASDCCWLIVSDTYPKGFAKIKWQVPTPQGEGLSAQLAKFYIVPHDTGQGYGSQLFTAVCDLARTRGEHYLWLEVLEKNIVAQRFYARQGMVYLKDTVHHRPSQNWFVQVLGKAL